jgi:hypothetical protein
VDFRVTVEGADLPPDVAVALTESVQVRLVLPAFPPHPSEGGVFMWLHGLYEADGSLLGFMPLLGQATPEGGYAVAVPASALGGTPFLPAQVGPGYVQNHDPEVHIWSGPTRLAADFGFAGPQFTTFTVVAPQVGARLFVYSPVVGNYGWIDVPGVGPSGPPT